MINELKENKPNIIFFNKEYNFIYLKPVEKRFQKIADFINRNYIIDKQIDSWIVYKKSK
jgi:hypothetical protein